MLIYQARGMDESSARRLATKLMSSPESAIEALARDELGIDPEELGGSAWEAAITSFLLFGAGAMIPVLPFLALQGSTAVAASVALSTIGLFTDRFGHHPFHRQVDPLFRRAAGALRACRSGRRLLCRAAGRRESRGMKDLLPRIGPSFSTHPVHHQIHRIGHSG